MAQARVMSGLLRLMTRGMRNEDPNLLPAMLARLDVCAMAAQKRSFLPASIEALSTSHLWRTE